MTTLEIKQAKLGKIKTLVQHYAFWNVAINESKTVKDFDIAEKQLNRIMEEILSLA